MHSTLIHHHEAEPLPQGVDSMVHEATHHLEGALQHDPQLERTFKEIVDHSFTPEEIEALSTPFVIPETQPTNQNKNSMTLNIGNILMKQGGGVHPIEREAAAKTEASQAKKATKKSKKR